MIDFGQDPPGVDTGCVMRSIISYQDIRQEAGDGHVVVLYVRADVQEPGLELRVELGVRLQVCRVDSVTKRHA